MRGEGVIVGSLALLAAYVLVANPGKAKKGATYRQLWAIGLLALVLGALNDVAPQVAAPFAVMVLAAGVVYNQGKLGKVLGLEPAKSSGR